MSTTTIPDPVPVKVIRQDAGIQSGTIDGGALAFSELKGGQHQDYQHEAPTMGGRRRRQNSKKRRGGSKKRHNNSKRRGHNNSKRRGHNNSKRQRGGK